VGVTFTKASERSCRTGKFYGSPRMDFCVAAANELERTLPVFAPAKQELRREDAIIESRGQRGGSLKGRSTFSFSSISRLLVRAGFPPLPALSRKDDGWRESIQCYWFKCPHCRQVVADYPHGYSRSLICPKCNAFTRSSS
jgi:hypothetical protein